MKSWEAVKLMEENRSMMQVKGDKDWQTVYGYITMDQFNNVIDASGDMYVGPLFNREWEEVMSRESAPHEYVELFRAIMNPNLDDDFLDDWVAKDFLCSEEDQNMLSRLRAILMMMNTEYKLDGKEF